jgi:hypothetical protein
MPHYRVTFTHHFGGSYEIEAADSDDAEEKAVELFESEETPSYRVINGDFEVIDVEPVTA